jgi:hypothetical protein
MKLSRRDTIKGLVGAAGALVVAGAVPLVAVSSSGWEPVTPDDLDEGTLVKVTGKTMLRHQVHYSLEQWYAFLDGSVSSDDPMVVEELRHRAQSAELQALKSSFLGRIANQKPPILNTTERTVPAADIGPFLAELRDDVSVHSFTTIATTDQRYRVTIKTFSMDNWPAPKYPDWMMEPDEAPAT